MSQPRVSVCLPVYNGEQFVAEAIRSVLAQDFADFELIITDNASTDGTADICRQWCRADPRVRYHRAPVNRGLAANHNWGVELARCPYLMWLGHDDLIAPELISRCAQQLDQNPDVVLCYSYASYIDSQGRVTRRVEHENIGAGSSPSERFECIFDEDHLCDAIFGLMKTRVLRQTRLHGPFSDSDRVLLAEMGLRGRFVLVPEFLFFRRWHESQTTTRFRDERARSLIFDPGRSAKINLPLFRKSWEFFLAVGRAPLPWKDRIRCWRRQYLWTKWTRHRFAREFVREAGALKSRLLGVS